MTTNGLDDARKWKTHRRDRDLFQWRSKEGDITIVFPGKSPFAASRFFAPKDEWTDAAEILWYTDVGCYKYNVTVDVPGEEPCVEDPEIVVDDDLGPIHAYLLIAAGVGLTLWGIKKLKKSKGSK